MLNDDNVPFSFQLGRGADSRSIDEAIQEACKYIIVTKHDMACARSSFFEKKNPNKTKTQQHTNIIRMLIWYLYSASNSNWYDILQPKPPDSAQSLKTAPSSHNWISFTHRNNGSAFCRRKSSTFALDKLISVMLKTELLSCLQTIILIHKRYTTRVVV